MRAFRKSVPPSPPESNSLKPLSKREKKEITNLIIKEIIIAYDNVKIIFNEIGLLNLVCEGSKNEQAKLITKNAEGLTQINISVSFRKRGGKSFITTPEGMEISTIDAKTTKKPIDTALINALVKADEWRRLMQKNDRISINEIARRKGTSSSYISRIYQLNFLAPDIKKAIFTNNIPAGLMLGEVIRNYSTDWDEQRVAFGVM